MATTDLQLAKEFLSENSLTVHGAILIENRWHRYGQPLFRRGSKECDEALLDRVIRWLDGRGDTKGSLAQARAIARAAKALDGYVLSGEQENRF